MQKGIKKVLTVLGVILVIFIILFLCKDPILDTIFYNMDATMDLPKDVKDYEPKSEEDLEKEATEYETEEEISNDSADAEEIYLVSAEGSVSLRDSPGSGEVIAKLTAGEQVYIIDDSTSPFVEVKLVDESKTTGYINQEYLIKEQSTNESE